MIGPNDFPPTLSAWMLSFLSNRKQFVKIGDSVSDICLTNAGAPQGTRAGPNDFKVLINDLDFETPYVKYVDDLSVVTISTNPQINEMQYVANSILEWSTSNHMILNKSKTKEMLIYFGKHLCRTDIASTVIQASVVERVETFKLLGVIFRSDLTWSAHVEYIVSKASKRIFAICQLIRSRIPVADVICVYCSLIKAPNSAHRSPELIVFIRSKISTESTVSPKPEVIER